MGVGMLVGGDPDGMSSAWQPPPLWKRGAHAGARAHIHEPRVEQRRRRDATPTAARVRRQRRAAALGTGAVWSTGAAGRAGAPAAWDDVDVLSALVRGRLALRLALNQSRAA